ncbi:hypothetical protein E6O75_ATG01044 [Venturia nashicola]|uniref:Uncharacterized protein n=1 Tax=Venturia nashicola TaxID=86259 RepID=A0A4Z1PKZ6_9PEZI|nr:hypothetical protein E6O75_ATG01044 [Venturia nashicola]
MVKKMSRSISPSAQLEESLQQSLQSALSTRRPLLHHLNADSSWLVQIPRPLNELGLKEVGREIGVNGENGVNDGRSRGRDRGRKYFNVLIDPWLSGPQSDVAAWFSTQWHADESRVGSIGAVEELIGRIERTARGGDGEDMDIDDEGGGGSCVDAVVVCHEFTDHCHKDTLLEVDKRVPVFGTKKAADLIRSWNHFSTVITIPAFTSSDPDWRKYSQSSLPPWLSISRLQSESDAFYYHSGILISFSSTVPALAQPSAESIIYTPHGLPPAALSPLSSASPPIKCLCLIHGLHDVSISWGQQLNLGAKNAVKAMEVLKAKYWVGTHDEVKKGGGLVSWVLNRKVLGWKDAVQEVLGDEGGRAPPVAELEHTEDSVSSLVDVDSPHISSVPSDYESQSVKTDTQASRVEHEAADKALEDKKAAEAKAKELKDKAKAKASKAESRIKANSDNPVILANGLLVGILGTVLGVGAYKKYAAGELSAKVVATWAGVVGLFAVGDFYASQYFFQKYPPKK